MLGLKYYFGEDLPQDYAKALDWFRRAARKGHNGGNFYMFQLHRLGQGTKVDHKRAFSYLRKSAADGHPFATYYLGDMELLGLGTKRSPKVGVKHVREAAEQGFAKAQLRMGILYHEGRDLPKNELCLPFGPAKLLSKKTSLP